MRAGLALLLACLSATPARPADPPIEELAAKLAEKRKEAAALEAELRERLKAFNALLVELGITPDVPPTPPVPPKPDALARKLRDAFLADKGAKDDALSLAALYRQAAALARDAGVTSSAELLRRVREASAALVGPAALPSLRTVVAGELAATLGTPSDAAFTDAQRKACADLFARLAVLLEGL
jgi:hypothetical protein